jgi:hypothetical protein
MSAVRPVVMVLAAAVLEVHVSLATCSDSNSVSAVVCGGSVSSEACGRLGLW